MQAYTDEGAESLCVLRCTSRATELGEGLRNPLPQIVPSSSSSVILSEVFLPRAVPRWKEEGGGCPLHFCFLHELIPWVRQEHGVGLCHHPTHPFPSVLTFCRIILSHHQGSHLGRIRQRTHGDLPASLASAGEKW